MASKYLQKFPIPAGFQQILSDFTREVLRDQPSNIIEYASQYFESLQNGKKFQFDSKYNVKKEDKKYELGYNAKNAQQITKKAGSITAHLNKKVPDPAMLPEQKPGTPKIDQAKNEPAKVKVQESGKLIQQSNDQADDEQKQQVPIIGTQKTVSGQQTTNYVDNLTDNIIANNEPINAKQQDPKVVDTGAELRKPAQPQDQKSVADPADKQKKVQIITKEGGNFGGQSLMEATIKNTVDKLFDEHDFNKNGFLFSKQIDSFVKAVLIEIGNDSKVEQSVIDQFMKIIDTDKDGQISKDQLRDFILKQMV